MHKYGIDIYWSHDDDLFVAEVPELAGCMAHGDSPATALAAAAAAIDLWLETAKQIGREVPQPKGRRGQLV